MQSFYIALGLISIRTRDKTSARVREHSGSQKCSRKSLIFHMQQVED